MGEYSTNNREALPLARISSTRSSRKLESVGGLQKRLEPQQCLEKIVVAIVERSVNLAASGLVPDAVLEQEVPDFVTLREVCRRRERDKLLHRERTVLSALLARNEA